jgi:hypothetical protein
VQPVTITNQAVSQVAYQFNVQGTTVVTGFGELRVNIGVTENGAGYYQNGAIGGYAFSAATGAGSNVSPASFTDITTNGPFCVTGTVASSYRYDGTVQVGVRLNQAPTGTAAPIGTYTPTGMTSVAYDVTNNNTAAGLVLILLGPNGATDFSQTWCVALPATTAAAGTVSLTEFRSQCLSGTACLRRAAACVGGRLGIRCWRWCESQRGLLPQ